MTRDRPEESLPPAYFEAKYAADPDPWRFATSAYEAAKYAATLQALPRPRYRSALELGCAIGVLSAALARRCERLLALDVVEAALVQARERCRDQPHVSFRQARIPDQLPGGPFDLVVMSEVGYYLNRTDLERTLRMLWQALDQEGHLVLVHWTPDATDYPLSGDQVHDLALAMPGFEHAASQRAETYRLDLLARSR